MPRVRSRAWHWNVEPGMEAAFEDLLGWLLSSQRGTGIESGAITPVNPSFRSAGSPSFRTCCHAVRFSCCARAA